MAERPSKRCRFTIDTTQPQLAAVVPEMPIVTLAMLDPSKPWQRVGVKCRVTFVSMAGTTQKGEHVIFLEVLDGTVDTPMKVTILGEDAVQTMCAAGVAIGATIQLCSVRCSVYEKKVNLISSAVDALEVMSLDDNNSLPAVPSVATCVLPALKQTTEPANAIARVVKVRPHGLVVEDTNQNVAQVFFVKEAKDMLPQIEEGIWLCLHRLRAARDGRLLMYPSGGLERISEDEFV